MKINIKDVEYVANLARLELSEEEKTQQLEKLNKILDYMEILDKVDTKGVQPLAHVLLLIMYLEKMKYIKLLKEKKLCRTLRKKAQGMFRVPKIV
jgi:aspartyl-tRNA(Asn)/glutamyl-tRNA(Gln) amidotransferase subunit C